MAIAHSNGADIEYDVNGTGDPLLLIIGFAADRRSWMLQTPVFAPQYKTITFDNRGMGGSTSPDGAVSMEQMADDALAVLDAAGVDRAHILGVSMGGAIAQHIALRAPDRVRSLILASTWCSKNPWLQRIAETGRVIMEAGGREATTRATMLWLFTPKFVLDRDPFVQQIEQMALEFAMHPEIFERQREACLQHDVRDQLAALDIPTRVMCGRRDIFLPPELSEELAAAIPGAELVFIEGGHAYQLESFEEFNQTVLEFLAKH